MTLAGGNHGQQPARRLQGHPGNFARRALTNVLNLIKDYHEQIGKFTTIRRSVHITIIYYDLLW